MEYVNGKINIFHGLHLLNSKKVPHKYGKHIKIKNYIQYVNKELLFIVFLCLVIKK